MTTFIPFEIEGSILIGAEIFNYVKVIGVDSQNKFVVLVYNDDGVTAHRVDKIYFGASEAEAALASRDRITQGNK